ncbi:MAG: ATP-grasp domain-containing protein [Flavobacteriales bacterium]
MKTIYILETNFAGNGVECAEAAVELGYDVIFICGSIKDYPRPLWDKFGIFKEVKVLDSYDITALTGYLAEEEAAGVQIAGILAFDDFRLLPAALVNSMFSPSVGPAVKALIKCRFKNCLRKTLEKSDYALSFTTFDIDRIQHCDVTFPCVVKPVDESGSVGVTICREESDFQNAVSFIKTRRGPNGRGYTISGTIIAEDYVEGPEFSAELYFHPGLQRWKILGFTRKFSTPPPSCTEIGHIYPCPLEQEGYDSEDVFSQLVEIVSLVGLRNTVLHFEFKLVNGRVKVIEINPRVAGGGIARLIHEHTKTSLNLLYLCSNLGLEPPVGGNDGHYYSVLFFIPKRAGTVREIRFDEPENTLHADIGALPQKIMGDINGDQRLGSLIVRSGSYKKALELQSRFNERYEVVYD